MIESTVIMRIYAAPAIVTFPAGRDTRHDHTITGMKRADYGTDLIDHADALMAEDASGSTGGHFTFKNVKIRPADRRL